MGGDGDERERCQGRDPRQQRRRDGGPLHGDIRREHGKAILQPREIFLRRRLLSEVRVEQEAPAASAAPRAGWPRPVDVLRRARPWAVGVHDEPDVGILKQMAVSADQARARVAAADIQDQNVFVRREQQLVHEPAHLRGRVGGLPLEVDGDARALEQLLRVARAHERLRLVEVEEVYLSPLPGEGKRQMHRELRLAAARLAEKDSRPPGGQPGQNIFRHGAHAFSGAEESCRCLCVNLSNT